MTGTSGTARPAGSYTITPSYGTLTAANYHFTTVNNGTLTVTQATLTVTASNKQRAYGAANPPLDGTLSGLVPGDNITVTYWTPATASSPLGTYLIEPSAFHDLDGKLPNYAWTLVNGTLTVVPASVDFGAKDVPSSSRQMATLAFAAAGTLNSISVVTQGTEQLDFGEDIVESGTCTLGTSYAAGDTCTVNVVFRPHYPGRSMGAVLLKNAGGTVLSTVYVQGSGNGALLVLNPRSQTTVATSVLDPHGVAADAAGNVYIADTGHNQVVKVSSVRPDDRVILSNVSTPVGTGLLQPHGVAVDGAGNVYIANTLGDTVVKVPADGSAQTTVGTGLLQPHGVTVDGAGNVYIADTGNSRAVKVPADGSAQTTVGTGLNTPEGIAVDGAGNVYIADSHHTTVVKVPADGSAQTTVGTGLLHPQGVAVDALGNVYVADTVNNRVVKMSADGGVQTTVASAPTATAPGTGVMNPFGVAVDGGGNVYIADADLVRRLDWTSQDSGVVTLENDGNRPLIFDSIVLSLGDVTTTCSTSSALNAAATCQIGVISTATTVTLVDNGRPGNPLLSEQHISLGENVPPTISQQFGAASIPRNGSTSLTFTIRNTNSSLTLTGVEFYASLPSAGLVVATPSNLNSSCEGTATATDGSSSIRLVGTRLTPGAFCTVSVNVAGVNTPGVFASNVTVSSTNHGTGNTSSESLVVAPWTILTVTADNKTMAYGGSLPTLTATLSGFVNGDTAAVVIGTAACSTTASSSSGGGTYPITCTAGTLSATNYIFSSFVGGTLSIWTPPTSAAVAIAYLDPAVTRAGSPAFTLHVYGGGFVNGAVVQWNGSPRTTAFSNSSNLTAAITAADIATSKKIAVTVKNQDGTISPTFWLMVDPVASGGQTGVLADTVALQVAPGQPATTTLTYPGNVPPSLHVTVNCLNLPVGASCSYDASTKKLSIITSANTPKGTYQIIVVVSYSVQVATTSHPRLLFAMLGPGIGLPFGLLWMGGRRRKRLHWGVLVLLALMMVVSLAGCGGHSDRPRRRNNLRCR